MEEWKECKLEDLCDDLSDGLHKAPKFVENGEYIFVNAKNLSNGKIVDVDKQKHTTYDEYLKYKIDLNKRTILYSIDGTIGNLAKYNNEKCVLGKGACYLNIKRDVSSDYIYYQLQTPHFKRYIHHLTTGSTIGHISLKTMRNYSFFLPPLPTQQKIAAILSSLDDKIELNNKINTNLEQQAGAIFKNWFVDDTSELIEAEIGKMDILITDYVANGSFKDLADNVKYLSNETDNVLIRLTDYNNNFSSDMVYISDDSYNFLEKSKLFGDEIIISNVGANVGTVFRCPRLNKKMSLAPNSIMIRGGIYEHYLYLYFTSNYGQGLLKSIVTGSAQPKFNKTNFRSLKIQIPREERLKKFNLIYDSLYEKIINNQKENLHLASLRNNLLPKLMNGEIEI